MLKNKRDGNGGGAPASFRTISRLSLVLLASGCFAPVHAQEEVITPDMQFKVPSQGGGSKSVYVPSFRTYTGSPYFPAGKNLALLADLKKNLRPFKIVAFDAAEPETTRWFCRASYPVYTPDRRPIEQVLADAMATELDKAGLYSEESTIGLVGHVESMDFSSVGSGKWTIEASFSVAGKEPVIVRQEYAYALSFGAAAACEQVRKAMVPTIQEFLHAVYSNERFIELVK